MLLKSPENLLAPIKFTADQKCITKQYQIQDQTLILLVAHGRVYAIET